MSNEPYVSDMSYEDAIKVMQQRRVRYPALVEFRNRFHVFSKTELLGSGTDYESALENAGLLPIPEDKRGLETLFGNHDTKVLKAGKLVCYAVTRNMAHRIANALNAYRASKDGY